MVESFFFNNLIGDTLIIKIEVKFVVFIESLQWINHIKK